MSHFFITTAIDYTNGAPHIGHAYEKVLADVLARYHRLRGDEVFYLTGVDQHGQKVQQSAEKAGVEPQAYVDAITGKFSALWGKLDVRYDAWAATTDAKHKECVRANLQMLWDDKVPGTDRSRWIYKKTQRGFYSVRQEQFLTDKERGPDGQFGPEWQPVEERDEENFYFRLTAHDDLGFDPKQWLLDLIDRRSAQGKPIVVPDFRVAELRNAVEKLDGDLCISRPASRLKWGIPFPESFGAGFVTYVWFDALVNYITYTPGHDPLYAERATGEPTEFQRWWPPLHVIGKDILIPAHGVYWLIMLKALGFSDEEMPTLLVHGWWNIAGAKMSKSLGNIVDPDAGVDALRSLFTAAVEKLNAGRVKKKEEPFSTEVSEAIAARCATDAVRFYLMSDMTTGRDADFSSERLTELYNAELANKIGNLLNRSLSMTQTYRAGKLSRPADATSYGTGRLPSKATQQVILYTRAFDCDERQIRSALGEVGVLATLCNEQVEEQKPWALAKDLSAESQAQLDTTLYTLAESLRIIAILISPVLPKAAHGIFDQLNWKMDEQGNESRFRLDEAQWGGLPDGHQLGTPTPLFPRLEMPVGSA